MIYSWIFIVMQVLCCAQGQSAANSSVVEVLESAVQESRDIYFVLPSLSEGLSDCHTWKAFQLYSHLLLKGMRPCTLTIDKGDANLGLSKVLEIPASQVKPAVCVNFLSDKELDEARLVRIKASSNAIWIQGSASLDAIMKWSHPTPVVEDEDVEV